MRTILRSRKSPRGIPAARVLLETIAAVGATGAVAADCEVGNLTPQDEVLPDIFVGAETIALGYVAILACPQTEPVFLPTVVHLQLQFDAEDVPCPSSKPHLTAAPPIPKRYGERRPTVGAK